MSRQAPKLLRAVSKSDAYLYHVWFDVLTTNGKRTFVRPELVEGLIYAHFATAPKPFRLN